MGLKLAAVPDLSEDLKAILRGAQTAILVNIAQAQAEAGDAGAALRTARAIELAYGRQAALARIAMTLAEAGDKRAAAAAITEAMDTASVIDTSSAHVYLSIGSTVIRITDPAGTYRRAIVLEEIAMAQARTGDVGAAMAIHAASADSARLTGELALWPALAFAEIATAQGRTGDAAGARTSIASALQAAHGIDAPHLSAIALTAIAMAQVTAGDKTGARMSITSARERLDADLPPPEFGISWFDYGPHAGALARLALAQFRLGDRKDAEATLAEALQVARQGRGEAGKFFVAALTEIAMAAAHRSRP
jgi:hypothetical protein